MDDGDRGRAGKRFDNHGCDVGSVMQRDEFQVAHRPFLRQLAPCLGEFKRCEAAMKNAKAFHECETVKHLHLSPKL
ncbi:hypothetical protein P4S72_30060, partial [Vibrio sp. PP-XX7]